MEFGHRESLVALLDEVGRAVTPSRALPLIGGRPFDQPMRPCFSPIDGETRVGFVGEADGAVATQAIDVANRGFAAWQARPPEERASILEDAADLLPILRRALADNTVSIIDCPVDYSENLKLTAKLGEMVCPI